MSSAIFYININGLGRSDVSENSPTPELVNNYLSLRANPFFRGLPFCNFVRNRVYVLNETRLQVVLMASKGFDNTVFCKILLIDHNKCQN